MATTFYHVAEELPQLPCVIVAEMWAIKNMPAKRTLFVYKASNEALGSNFSETILLSDVLEHLEERPEKITTSGIEKYAVGFQIGNKNHDYENPQVSFYRSLNSQEKEHFLNKMRLLRDVEANKEIPWALFGGARKLQKENIKKWNTIISALERC